MPPPSTICHTWDKNGWVLKCTQVRGDQTWRGSRSVCVKNPSKIQTTYHLEENEYTWFYSRAMRHASSGSRSRERENKNSRRDAEGSGGARRCAIGCPWSLQEKHLSSWKWHIPWIATRALFFWYPDIPKTRSGKSVGNTWRFEP